MKTQMSGYLVTYNDKRFSCESYLISKYHLHFHNTTDVHFIQMYTHNRLMYLACLLS